MKVATEQLGYTINCYDRCILTPGSKDPSQRARTKGFVVLKVDDSAEGGSALHQTEMAELEKVLKFGKVDDLRTEAGSNYAGRRVRQLKDFSFEISMDESIYTRLEPIQLQRKVLAQRQN